MINLKDSKIFLKPTTVAAMDAAAKIEFDVTTGLVTEPESFFRLNSDELAILGIGIASENAFSFSLESLHQVNFKKFRLNLNVFHREILVNVEPAFLPIIERFGELYLVPHGIYRIFQINQVPWDSDDLHSSQIERLAEIKEIANNCPLLKLDKYLTENEYLKSEIFLEGQYNDKSNHLEFHVRFKGLNQEESKKAFDRYNPFGRNEISHVKDGRRISIRPPKEQRTALANIKTISQKLKNRFGSATVPREHIPGFLDSIDKLNINASPLLTNLSSRIDGFGIFVEKKIPSFEATVDGVDFTTLIFPTVPVDAPDPELIERGFETLAVDTLDKVDEMVRLVNEAESQAKSFVQYKGAFVNVAPHEAVLKQLEFQREKLTASFKDGQNKVPVLLARENLNQLNYISDVRREYSVTVQGNRKLPSCMRARFESRGKIRPLILHDFQWEGLWWFQSQGERDAPYHCGGIMADVMGLGKTLQAITYICHLKDLGQLNNALIICPKTLISTWFNEIKKFVDLDKFGEVFALDSLNKSPFTQCKMRFEDGNIPTVLITSYDQLKIHSDSLARYSFSAMICDEAQTFKNPGILLHNSLRAQNAERRFALTGTPVENRLLDLWSIMDVVKPGLLGTMEQFIEEYEKPIQNLPDTSPERMDFASKLQEKITPYFLRRTKGILVERGELKAKIANTTHLPLTTEQLQIYSNWKKAVEENPRDLIGITTELRIRCSNPSRYPQGREREVERLIALNPKLEWLIETIVKIRAKNEKVLIFDHYSDNLALLKTVLEAKFPEIAPILKINKDVSYTSRSVIVEQFEKSDSFDILLLTPGTSGVGLTLISANHVVHFTRGWNPAKEEQATDRAYRVGQEKDVFVYYPIMVFPKGGEYSRHQTIEQRIHEVLTGKIGLIDDFTQPAAKINKSLVSGFADSESASSSDYDDNAPLSVDNIVTKLNEYEFEAFCAILLERSPLFTSPRVILTPRSGYGSCDIIVIDGQKRWLFEVKQKQDPSKNLGDRGLQQLALAKGALVEQQFEVHRCVLISNARRLTIQAQVRCELLGFEFWNYDAIDSLLNEVEGITYADVRERDSRRERYF